MFFFFFFKFFFFFNDTATTEIYTLSLHDALPISGQTYGVALVAAVATAFNGLALFGDSAIAGVATAANVALTGFQRSEEHTSELQSLTNLVCRLLLEKKKKKY